MKIVGLHPITSPFIGHGQLTFDGIPTGNLRGLPLEQVVERIGALTAGVTASIDENEYLVLESPRDFTLDGHQDVLDVIGLSRTDTGA